MIANWARAKGDNTDGLGYNIDLFDYAFSSSHSTELYTIIAWR